MGRRPVDPELKERAIRYLLPPYNCTMRQVAEDNPKKRSAWPENMITTLKVTGNQ